MAAQSKSRISRITSPAAPEPAPGTWSNCLVVNGVAYVAGLVARGKDGKAVRATSTSRPRTSSSRCAA